MIEMPAIAPSKTIVFQGVRQSKNKSWYILGGYILFSVQRKILILDIILQVLVYFIITIKKLILKIS